MDPLTLMLIFSAAGSAVSAYGQVKAGEAAREEARLNAKNLANEKEMNKVVAKQNMIARLEKYKENTSQNIAQFSGRTDKSVEAFMRAQKEIVGKDIRTIQTQGYVQEQADKFAIAAEIARGEGAHTAAKIGAATTLLKGVSNYYAAKT